MTYNAKNYVNLKDGTLIDFIDGGLILHFHDNKYYPIKVNNFNALILYLLNLDKSIDEVIKIITNNFNYCNIDAKIFKLLEIISNYIVISDRKKCINDTLSKAEINKILNRPKKLDYNSRPNKPSVVSFSITNDCLMNCIYCYAGSKKTNDLKPAILPIEKFKSILDECKEIGIESFELTGGDPFAVYNIIDYVELLINSGLNWFMSTKAYINRDIAIKLKDIGLKYIQVSLDSYIEETVDYLTGVQGSYQGVIKTIKNLINNDIKVRLKSVITSINIKEIPGFIEFSEKLGVNNISFSWFGVTCGRYEERLYPSLEDILWLNKEMTIIKSSKPNLQIEYAAIDDSFNNFINGSLLYKSYHRKKCGASKLRLTIRPDGKVPVCEYITKDDRLIVGDIYKNSILEIWNSQKILSIIYPGNKENFKDTKCHACELFEKCYERRCFMRSLIKYNSPFNIDPWCLYGDINFKFY